MEPPVAGLSRRHGEKQTEAPRRLPGLSPISPALGSSSGGLALLLGALLLAPLLELLLGLGRRFARYVLLFVCHNNHLARDSHLVSVALVFSHSVGNSCLGSRCVPTDQQEAGLFAAARNSSDSVDCRRFLSLQTVMQVRQALPTPFDLPPLVVPLVMLPSPHQTARMMRRKVIFAVRVENSSLSSLLLHDTSKASAGWVHVLRGPSGILQSTKQCQATCRLQGTDSGIQPVVETVDVFSLPDAGFGCCP